MTTEFTQNFRLSIPDFDSSPWHQLIQDDLRTIDALLMRVLLMTLVTTWTNSTNYLVGDIVVSPEDGSIWSCQVAHASAASPTTFSADRLAHPTFWLAVIFKDTIRIVTAAGVITVSASERAVLVNKAVGAATTVNLPASALRGGKPITIKDYKGDANTNNITIVASGAETIDGFSSAAAAANGLALIDTDFGRREFFPLDTGGYYT